MSKEGQGCHPARSEGSGRGRGADPRSPTQIPRYARDDRRSHARARLALAGEPLASLAFALASLLTLPASAQPLFVERAAELGLDFVHFNGMTGKLYFAENMGSGAALFDYDGDGDLDAFLVQGAPLEPGKGLDDAVFPPPASMRPVESRLYRNDLQALPDGRLEPRFVEVTEASGIDERDYGMSAAVGDVEGDGFPDLFVGGFGPDRLWANRGDGTFADATARAGVSDPSWSAAAAFFDADDDGDEDLYVANYLAASVARHVQCFSPASAPDYCGPLAYPPETDRLYRNLGGGRFEDISARSGISIQAGAGLGVVAGDFDGDSDADLYVANDEGPNFLWLRGSGGTYEEAALLGGCALSEDGQPEASMGIAIGDVDRDGDEDLLVANRSGEGNTLYLAEGGGLFRDASRASGLKAASLAYTAFGTQWLDVDNDGRLDLFTANGEIQRIEAQVRAGSHYPLAQHHQLFRQRPDGRFEEATAAGGEAFARPVVGRGAAFGDVDNDGDTDVLVNNNSGPAHLLLNQAGQQAAWLSVRAVAADCADAIGARLELAAGAGKPLLRVVRRDGSYSSANDPRAIFGLGEARAVDALAVRWPDGRRQRFLKLPVGAFLTVVALPRE